MSFAQHAWYFLPGTVLLAGLLDVTAGDPPNRFHPVAWLGRLIETLAHRQPKNCPASEFRYGVFVAAATIGLAGAAGFVLDAGFQHLPLWIALPLGAWALKSSFSLRGLVEAGKDVESALTSDVLEAQTLLAALVSRPRDLDPPLIVSAAVESLAENLTDSVVSPLMYYVLLGLPGALAYRAVNTLDAMLGYRDHREYVGKTAARIDDVANYVPTRLTALLIVLAAGLWGRTRAAWRALRTQPQRQYGPNKTVAIATMAGALDVQLEKPGAYTLGIGHRQLTPSLIDEATRIVWIVGGAMVIASAVLTGLLTEAGWR